MLFVRLGLNQLLWYYADMEKKRCPTAMSYSSNANVTTDSNACIVWRRFAKYVTLFDLKILICKNPKFKIRYDLFNINVTQVTVKSANIIPFIVTSLFETAQTLFWAVFGLVDLESFELDGIKAFTRFWGMLMFGTYSVINIVVLLNLLIAMMNHSYQLISVSEQISIRADCRRVTIERVFFLILIRNVPTSNGSSPEASSGSAISRKEGRHRRRSTSSRRPRASGTWASGCTGNSAGIAEQPRRSTCERSE